MKIVIAVLAGFGLLAVVVCGGIAFLLFLGSPVSRSPVPVKYAVTGSAVAASLTYTNASGNTEQRDVTLPWEMTLTVKPGTFVSVSAQNMNASGTIACLITAEGKSIERSSSSGAYKIASCSGRVP